MASQLGTPRTDHNEAIAEFSSITGETAETANSYLESSGWVMESALAVYYEAHDEPQESDDGEAEEEPRNVDTLSVPPRGSTSIDIGGGGRRLGGEGDLTPAQPTPSSAPTTTSAKPPQQKKKFGTLKDLQSDSHAGHGHDDDDGSDKEQEFYAGGDKSGLAVQDPSSANPRDQIQRLMNTARRGGPRPPQAEGAEEQPPRRSYFGGAGQTLGGDDAESQVIPATEVTPQQPRNVEMVERILHLWQDGFSVDDGPLYRYDDPANRRTLDMINSGSAPMDLMNVQNGQAVDVKLMNHPNENYVQPKKKSKPFENSGQRLGSPVPGVPATSASSPSTQSAAIPSSNSSAAPTPSVNVDSAQPTLSLQIRLADGSRLPSRFNTTHTVGDVYEFIERAQPGGYSTPYVLATTFPTKDLTDKGQVLGDMAEFKRGGVVVQKWT